jgi:photosystem I P700 chlorophyll a apoprotein A1
VQFVSVPFIQSVYQAVSVSSSQCIKQSVYQASAVVLYFRYVSSQVWSQAGHFSGSLSKGPKSTSWIWNLHSLAHDFDIQTGSASLVARKVFSSGLAHLSLVFLWFGFLYYQGAYYSNYIGWLKDPSIHPSAHIVSFLIGQDILNSSVQSNSFQGIHITSGLFQVWRASGTISVFQLKQQVVVAAFGTASTLLAAYFHQHPKYPSLQFYQQFKCLSIHHLILFIGLGSISWSGHQVHISVPIASLLEAGISPEYIPVPQQLLGLTVYSTVYSTVYPITTQAYISIHHLTIGLVSIVTGIVASRIKLAAQVSWHFQLSVNLAIIGSISIFFAHHISSMPTVYPMLSMNYPTLISLFSHHINIGALFILGSTAHTSIFIMNFFFFGLYSISS